MSKGLSGWFHGTLGTTRVNNTEIEISYTDRGVEIPENIKKNLSKLKKKGDYIIGSKNDFSMKEVSIMSKESGVEFAKVVIGDKAYLIRGDKNGTYLSETMLKKIEKKSGILEFHSHPYDNDSAPSWDDLKMMGHLLNTTGQKLSKIVTPNGKVTVYDDTGAVEMSVLPNKIDIAHKKALLKLFGGGVND